MAIVVRAVFHENNLYHSLVFLDECLYKIEKGRVKMNLKKLILFWWNIKDIDFNFSGILSDQKLYENISVYKISYEPSNGPKPLHFNSNKVDEFIRIRRGEFRHLVLFDYGLFDKICDKIKYLISEKKGITESINHNFGKIRICPFHYLLIENVLTFCNVIILIKSVVNKNKSSTTIIYF